MKRFTLILYLIFAMALTQSLGQTLNLNYELAKANVRRNQLLGNDSLNASLMQWDNYQKNDSASSRNYLLGKEILRKNDLSVKVLPVTIKSVFSPSYPTYANDGIIASQVGNQLLFTAGLNMHSKWISFQLSPEFSYQEIKSFSPIPWESGDKYWNNIYANWNRTDAVTAGANMKRNISSLGQTYLYINLYKISFGASNSNLFWGPGQFHSLILSNHASSFPYATLHSNSPINIGSFLSFEFQIINGWLTNSEFELPFPAQRISNNPFESPKLDENRYLSAFNFSVNPKFIPGFYLGFSRSIQQYWSDAQTFNNYFPVFDLFFRGNDNGRDDLERKDQLISINMRWVEPRSQLEIYYVYGRNDAAWNFRDLIMSPQHSMSNLTGLSKVFNKRNLHNFQLRFESVSTSQTVNKTLRDAGSWYRHSQVRQGMTNQGEVLGAGIPIGSNQQLIDFSTFEGLNNLGFMLSRTTIDEEFVRTYVSQTNIERRWVQLSTEIYGNYLHKSFLFSTNLNISRHHNFQYVLDENRTLLNTQFSITWLLK